jgi:hypothetical protein
MKSWNAEKTCSLRKTKKIVKLKDAFALEVEKCKNLTKELNTCNDSMVAMFLHLPLSMLLFALDVEILMLML